MSDIASWLTALGLEKYAPIFAENEVVPRPGEPTLDEAILKLVGTGAHA